MNHEEDRLGVPTPGSVHTIPPPDDERPPERESEESREGDTGLGRPKQVPAELRDLSDRERALLERMEMEEIDREVAEAEQALTSKPELLGLPRAITGPLAAFAVFGLGGALGLFLFSQTLSILGDLAAQPAWLQYAGYGLLGVLGLGVLYAIARLAVFYLRMKRNQQVRMKGVEELARRTHLRWLARAKSQEARHRIEEYLRAYPLESDKDRKALTALGITEATLAELEKARENLLDADQFATTEQWFARFQETFQQRLDELAEARVQYWAKRTGVVTALAPNGLVDASAALYFTFVLLGDLCRIYNLRAGSMGTAVLLARVFFNAYLAGQGTGIEKFTEQQIEEMFHPGGMFGEAVMARLFAKAGSKMATGALNFFLLRRLGRFAARLLKPVG